MKDKKRILVPYATYGNGHKAIAEYIKKYFDAENNNYEVVTLDVLAYTNKFFGVTTKKSVEKVWERVPILWTFLYKTFDNKISTAFLNRMFVFLINNKKLRAFIEEFNPDLTISTHFFGSSLISQYNVKGICNSKLITVVTDYESHGFWLQNHKLESALIVGDKEEVKSLAKKGIDKKIIKPFGIPIAPYVPIDFDKNKLLDEYGLNRNNLTCLFFGGGGNGAKSVLPYIKKAIKENLKLNIIFVAGKSKVIQNKAKEYAEKYNNHNVKVLGFVTNVPEILMASDFVVSKPGGGQTTENLYFRKPTLLILGTGGQESANIKYFIKNNYGKRMKTANQLQRTLKWIVTNPKRLERMQKKLNSNDNKKAMENLYNLSVDVLRNKY